jgi:hypothetical protein
VQAFETKPYPARQTVHVPTATGHLLQWVYVHVAVQLVIEAFVYPLAQVVQTSTFESHAEQLRIEQL